MGPKLKPAVFAAIAAALFFGLVEIALWCAGVPTLLSEHDPFVGFSERVPVFELDAGRGLYRTPRRATEHSFNYQEFRAAKPADGFRVFVLGGSSAFGFPWGARVAFPRLLGDALRAAWPERSIEVVNAAAMSYGSHRLRILTHELLRYDPDLLILHEGHNEFVERRFYRDHLVRADALDGVQLALARWRLYSMLSRVYRKLAHRAAEPDPAGRSAGEPRSRWRGWAARRGGSSPGPPPAPGPTGSARAAPGPGRTGRSSPAPAAGRPPAPPAGWAARG